MSVIDTYTLGYTIAGIIIFLLWYTLMSSRLFGFLVSLILRLVVGDKIVLDIKGIHIALLTGRIYFRRLTYVTPNAALSVLDGTLRIFWWRSPFVFGIPEQDQKSDEKKKCHISITLNGLEYTIANNSNRREQIEKILSMRSGKETQVGVQNPQVAATLPFLFKMSPRILVSVHRGVISIGNDEALSETSLVASFDSAKAVIHTMEAAVKDYVYGLLVSAQLRQLTVREQPPLQKVPDFKQKKDAPSAPVRVAPSDVFGPNFKFTNRRSTDQASAQRAAPAGRLSVSFLDVDRIVDFGRNIKQLGSHAIGILEGAGAKLMKLDEHLLSLLTHHEQVRVDHRGLPAGTVILKCSSLLMKYHQECDAVAPSIDSQPPLWKIELNFHSSYLRYGPAEHSIRNAISRYFLPWTFEAQTVKPLSTLFANKEFRGFDYLTIDIRFQEVVDVLVPFDAQISSNYPELHVELPAKFRRVLREDAQNQTGWLHLKCGNGVSLEDIELQHENTLAEVAQFDSAALLDSDPFIDDIEAFLAFSYADAPVGRIEVEVPWACRTQQGTEMKVEGSLEGLVVRTSICNHPFIISENLDISVNMPYPVVWNSYRVWTVSLSFTNSHLQYLADHVTLLSQLGAHWSRGDPVQRIDFVPYDMKIHVEMKTSFDLRLIASPNNSFHVAGKSMGLALDPGTPLLLLQGSSLEASIVIPLNKFLRPSMNIFYEVNIKDTAISLIPGVGSFLEASLSNESHEFVTGASIGLKGVYAYFYDFTPDSRDVFSMDVKCDHAKMVIQPYYLSALNSISKNYFGADKRAMSPSVLSRRGGVNQAEFEAQQQLRRAKGDSLNQSDSYITVHMQNTELLLPLSLLSDRECATASIPSLVIELHSSYLKSSFSDIIIDCAPLVVSFPQAPIEITAISANPMFPDNGVGNVVLEGLYFKSSSLYGPKPEFSCYCTSKEIVVSSIYGTLLPLQMQHLVKVGQNLLGDWSFGTDLYVCSNHDMSRKQLNSTFLHMKSVHLTVLFSPFSLIASAKNVTYDSSNDYLDFSGPQSVWTAPEVIIRVFLHDVESSMSDLSSNVNTTSTAKPPQSGSDIHAFEMLHLSVPLTYSSTIVRSCIGVDAATQRDFWTQQDNESGRLQFNDDDGTKSSPRSAASNAASTAGGNSSASSRVRRRSVSVFARTGAPSGFEHNSTGAEMATVVPVAAPLMTKESWYELTAETPRGDLRDDQKAFTTEENIFDVNDFESAHSSVSTPNEDDLHSARSLSSDGGDSRIVVNDVDIGSSFSTPRELGIHDHVDDKSVMPLHVSATLKWCDPLTICGHVGQSLYSSASSGPILDFPTFNSSHFDSESRVDNRFQLHSNQSRDVAAGVGGDVNQSNVDSDMTTSDCDGNNSKDDESWSNFKTLIQAEFEEGDKRSCHSNNELSFTKGIHCRLNAMAPTAIEVIVEYLLPFKHHTASVAELQLPLPHPSEGSPNRLVRAPSSPDSPKQSKSESAHALISLFEYVHQAVRSASFSSPDAMLLQHTMKRLFSLTVSFVSIDIYPPPRIKNSLFASVSNRGYPGFSVVRFVASGLKYKVASKTDVPEALLKKKSGVLALQPLPSPSVVKHRITLKEWACIGGSDSGVLLPFSDCESFSKQFPNCHMCGAHGPKTISFLISCMHDIRRGDSIVFASSFSSKIGEPSSSVSSLTFPRALAVSAGRFSLSGVNTLVVTGMTALNAQKTYTVAHEARLNLALKLKSSTKPTKGRLNPRSKSVAHFDHMAAAAAASLAHASGKVLQNVTQSNVSTVAGVANAGMSHRKASRSASVNVVTPTTSLPPDIMMSPSRQLRFSPDDSEFSTHIRDRSVGNQEIDNTESQSRINSRVASATKKDALSSYRIPAHLPERHQNLLSDFFQACPEFHALMNSENSIERIQTASVPSGQIEVASNVHNSPNVNKSFNFHFEDLTFGMYFSGSSSQGLKLSLHSVSGRSVTRCDKNDDITVFTCSEISIDAKDHCIEAVPHLVELSSFWKANPARSLFEAIKSNYLRRNVAFASESSSRRVPETRRASVDDFGVFHGSSLSRTVSFQAPLPGHVRSHSDPAIKQSDLSTSPFFSKESTMPLSSNQANNTNHHGLQVEVGRISLKLRSPDIKSEVMISSESFLYTRSGQRTQLPPSNVSISAELRANSSPIRLRPTGDMFCATSLIEICDISIKYVNNAGAYEIAAQEMHVKRVLLHHRQSFASRVPSFSLCSVECVSVDLKSYIFDGGLLVMFAKNWTPKLLPTQPEESVSEAPFLRPLACFDLMVDSVSIQFQISPRSDTPVMPIEFYNCHASFAENDREQRFVSLSFPRQRACLSDKGRMNTSYAQNHVASKQFARGTLHRRTDSSNSGDPLDIDFASMDLHVAISPTKSDERSIQVLCCIGSTHNVINSELFNHLLQLFRILSNEMFSVIETVSKQSLVRSVFKKHDKRDVGSVLEAAIPEMLSELGYTVSPQTVLQFSNSCARVTFLEFLAITQVFASSLSLDPHIALRKKQFSTTPGTSLVSKSKAVFNKVTAAIFIKPIHITAVTNPASGHGALAIFDSGQMFARISTSAGSSVSWSLRFTDLNVQFNRLINWQHSTGQFSLRNLFHFNTTLELRNQVMPAAFKGDSSVAADFSRTKLCLQPGCQNCISDVVSHFSSAFSAFSANINRDSSQNSEKLRSDMSAAAKSLVEYAKSSAAALESSVSLAVVVIKIQDIVALASYDEAGGQVFGPFNFGCMENTRDAITSVSCLPDVALSFAISSITFIVLARGKSNSSHKSKDMMHQSLQFQGRVRSALFRLFVNQGREKSPSSLQADNFVGLNIHDWTLKVLWKFSTAHRPSSLDAIYRLAGPSLRLFPDTISSISLCVDRWTSFRSPTSAATASSSATSSADSQSHVPVERLSAPSSMIHINISVKIDSGQVVLLRRHNSDSVAQDALGGGQNHLKFMKNAETVSIDEVCKLPLPGIAVKVALVVNRTNDIVGSEKIVSPLKSHKRRASKEVFDLFSADSFAFDKSLPGQKRDDALGPGLSGDDTAKSGRHRRKASGTSETSFPDIEREKTNIVNITFSAGTIQVSPKILEFFSELRALMPPKVPSRSVQRRSSSSLLSQNTLNALASDNRVAAAKNAIADHWLVLHIILEESKLELRGDGKLSDHVLSFKVANSSIIYNAGQSIDASSSSHFVSLYMEQVQLLYSGKSEVYGMSDTTNRLTAESVFVHSTTILDDSGDQSVGFCECQKLDLVLDFTNPDVYFKATLFLQQWTMFQPEPAGGSAHSSPMNRRDIAHTLARGNSAKSVSSDDGTPVSNAMNAPLNLRERCFFYHFVVRTLGVECDVGRDQNQYFVAQISPLSLSVSNPLTGSDPETADVSGICYTLGWNDASFELSCKIRTTIATNWSYIHLKKPHLLTGEDNSDEESQMTSTSVALTGIITSVFEIDQVLEEICFFDVGTFVSIFMVLPEENKVLVDVFYSDLKLCVSASSIVSLRKSFDQFMLVFNERMAWRADDSALTTGPKRRMTLIDDDKGLLSRRRALSEKTSLSEKTTKPQLSTSVSSPSDTSQNEIGYLCITGQNTLVHIFGSTIADRGLGWNAAFSNDYLAINLDSFSNSGAIVHSLVLEIHNVLLRMNQGFSFNNDNREIKNKKEYTILRIDDETKLRVLGKPTKSKTGSESISCELTSEFSKSLHAPISELYLFKNLKTLLHAYSAESETSSVPRHGAVAKSKGRASNREYHVQKCILQPKFDAAGEGSEFTMATLLKHLGVGATADIVPLIYASLVDPLLAVRAQGALVLKMTSGSKQ